MQPIIKKIDITKKPKKKIEFMECDSCRKKPGSPPLCGGCLANRESINRLNKALLSLNQAWEERVREAIKSTQCTGQYCEAHQSGFIRAKQEIIKKLWL